MSKTNYGIVNTLRIKSKKRYGLSRKYKSKDMNKKTAYDMSYRSKCKNPDPDSGYKTLKEMKEAA